MFIFSIEGRRAGTGQIESWCLWANFCSARPAAARCLRGLGAQDAVVMRALLPIGREKKVLRSGARTAVAHKVCQTMPLAASTAKTLAKQAQPSVRVMLRVDCDDLLGPRAIHRCARAESCRLLLALCCHLHKAPGPGGFVRLSFDFDTAHHSISRFLQPRQRT
jgi:hypothetical protein